MNDVYHTNSNHKQSLPHSYSLLPVDRKLTKEEYGKWKLDSDIERFETAMNDPTDPFSSPLDEIRLKHMKDMRDKNVTKRQN